MVQVPSGGNGEPPADVTRRISAVANGRRFAIEVPASLADAAMDSLPFGSQVVAGDYERMWEVRAWGPGVWAAANDEGLLAQLPDPLDALEWLMGDLEMWVAERAEDLIFVHAGAVTWGGTGIVVPGRTHAGKSTLVAALVQAGATYYSDEYAVLGRDGLLRPYARRLSLRPPGGGRAQQVAVAELGGVAGLTPAPIGLVAQLQYDAHKGWRVDELGGGRTALALLDNTVAARTRTVEVMDHLQAACRSCTGLTGTRGAAPEAAELLLGLVRSGAVAQPPGPPRP